MRTHPKAITAIMGDSPPQTYPTWGLPTGLQLFMNCSSVGPFPRVMASFGCSHLLWHGVLHGLQTDVRPPLTSMVCRGSACHLTSGCWKLCSGTPPLLLLHWPWSLHTCFPLTSDCSPPLKKTKEKKLHSSSHNGYPSLLLAHGNCTGCSPGDFPQVICKENDKRCHQEKRSFSQEQHKDFNKSVCSYISCIHGISRQNFTK